MSEEMSAAITIGGTATMKVWLGLIETLSGQCENNYRDDPDDEAFIEWLEAKREALEWGDGDASWGKFEEAEAYCVEHRLTFIRTNEGKYDCDALRCIFKPPARGPKGEPHSVLADSSGIPHYSIGDLRLWAQDGKQLDTLVHELTERDFFDVPPVKISGKRKRNKRVTEKP